MRFVNPTLKRLPKRNAETEFARLMYCRTLLATLGLLTSDESAAVRGRIEARFPEVCGEKPRVSFHRVRVSLFDAVPPRRESRCT